MFAPTLFLVALGAQAALAAPNLVARWPSLATNSTAANTTNSTNSTVGGVNDTQILQFALNLEYLESTFYAEGLATLNASAFQNAGFDPTVRERFVQIAEHEATHVLLLQDILGPDAPQPCNYSFPFTDPLSFVTLAFALESAGESAYLGAAASLTNKSALTLAGTILAVEARQAGYIGDAVLNNTPWNGPFDSPLNASEVFSLASSFILACPSTNPPLPIQPLPVLQISPVNATAGTNITVFVPGTEDFSPANIPIVNASATTPIPSVNNGTATPFFLAYYNGTNFTYSALNPDNTTTIPEGLAGVVYTQLVSTNLTAPSNETVLTGLAVLNIPVPANSTTTTTPTGASSSAVSSSTLSSSASSTTSSAASITSAASSSSITSATSSITSSVSSTTSA